MEIGEKKLIDNGCVRVTAENAEEYKYGFLFGEKELMDALVGGDIIYAVKRGDEDGDWYFDLTQGTAGVCFGGVPAWGDLLIKENGQIFIKGDDWEEVFVKGEQKRLTVSQYVRLYEDESRVVKKIADDEYLGNISFTIRKLVLEALEARKKK